MERYLYIIMFLAQLTFISTSSNSIFNKMQHDRSMCKVTVKFLSESNLMNKCKTIEYPSENVEFEIKNIDLFSCIALYDIGFSLCNLGSRNYIMKLPENSTIFESDLKVLKSSNVCLDFELSNLMLHQEIGPKVGKFYNALKDQRVCREICEEFQHPICLALLWIRNIFTNAKKPSGIFASIDGEPVSNPYSIPNNGLYQKIIQNEFQMYTAKNEVGRPALQIYILANAYLLLFYAYDTYI